MGNSVYTPNGRINPNGGFDVLLVAGEDLYQGEVVEIGTSDGQVVKAEINEDAPIGTVYADALSGQPVWITVAGVGYAKPTAGVTATRNYVIYCSGTTAGRVDQSATLPAVAAHNREVGHFLYTGSGNGVPTLAILHWN